MGLLYRLIGKEIKGTVEDKRLRLWSFEMINSGEKLWQVNQMRNN